jgi:hypothetical protein
MSLEAQNVIRAGGASVAQLGINYDSVLKHSFKRIALPELNLFLS